MGPVKLSPIFYDALTLRVFATGRDFTVDARGSVVGDRSRNRDYSEYWTLIEARASAAHASRRPSMSQLRRRAVLMPASASIAKPRHERKLRLIAFEDQAGRLVRGVNHYSLFISVESGDRRLQGAILAAAR
jgi:hypothetical protein